MNHKAISPVIGTLLMILIVLGISAVIYGFGTSFTKKGLGEMNILPKEENSRTTTNSCQEEDSTNSNKKKELHYIVDLLAEYKVLTVFAVSTTIFFIAVLKWLIGKTPPPRR
jgi:flagellin-like protein